MKINEIITEAPVGIGGRIKNAVLSKMPGSTGALAKGNQQAATNANNLYKNFLKQLGASGKKIQDVDDVVLKKFFKQYGTAPKTVDDAMLAVGLSITGTQDDTGADTDAVDYDSPTYLRRQRAQQQAQGQSQDQAQGQSQATSFNQGDAVTYTDPASGQQAQGTVDSVLPNGKVVVKTGDRHKVVSPDKIQGPAQESINEAMTKSQLEQVFLKVVQMDPNLQKSDSEKIPGKVIDAIKALSPAQQAALSKALSK